MPGPEELAAAGLRYHDDGRVATITLCRPDVHNAQTPTMWRALAALGTQIPEDVSVVVVKGEGPSFSSGLDRRMLAGPTPGEENVADLLARSDAEIADTIGDYQEGFTWLRDPRWLSVAAVQGHCVGAGFQLALACDLRVLADDAQLCMYEAALGLVPDLTGTQPLVEAVGYSRALEICVTARRVPAEEAARIGLAHHVVPRADLDSAVDVLVGALAAHSASVTREIKALMRGAANRTLDEQRLRERTAQIGRFRDMAKRMSAGR